MNIRRWNTIKDMAKRLEYRISPCVQAWFEIVCSDGSTIKKKGFDAAYSFLYREIKNKEKQVS